MGVTVTGRNYDNQYRPEVVDWLLGNTGDWQELTIVCRFGVEKKFTTSSPLQIDGNDFITTDAKPWASFGFDIGDSVVYSFDYTKYDSNGNVLSGYPINFTGTRNITFIGGDTITVDGASLGNETMPSNTGREEFSNVIVYSDKRPEGAIINYGHLTNTDSDSANLSSFIDGTLTKFGAIGLDTLTGWQNMIMLGNQSGMSVNEANWVYWGKIGTHYYQYAFNIEFMISSFFESLSNFELKQAPSQVFDASSLTDNFEIIGFPEWNNPNTSIKSDKQRTKRLGNTGWFDENFNGLTDNFSISGLSYTDVQTGNPLSRLNMAGETAIECTISGVHNLAQGLNKCGIGFVWLPEDESYYKNLPTPFHKNLMMNTAGGYISGVFVPTASPVLSTYNGFETVPNRQMQVKNVHFEIVGGDLVYRAIWSPTPEFTAFMDSIDESERNYALWVSVADRLEVTNFSDRVSKLIDYNSMERYVPPVGAWSPMAVDFYTHPHSGTPEFTKCNYDMYVEDDILSKIKFNVDVNDVIPSAINFVIEAENTTTGEKHFLQDYKVDLSVFPVDSLGVPQWNYDQSRGFKLEPGNNKNWVKVQREQANDSLTNYGYVAYYGFKIRWEDWIERLGVPSDFFDVSEKNNGFHNDWIHYLNEAGWKMSFTVYLDAVKNGKFVRYENEKSFTFNDYDSNPNVTTDFKFFRDSDNASLGAGIDPVTGKPLGTFLANELIRLEAVFNRNSGTWSSLADVYATICLEVDEGSGQFDFRQLSTEYGSESDNPLIPETGQTNVKLTLASPTQIIASCLVDTNKLPNATRFKLSSRIGCKN